MLVQEGYSYFIDNENIYHFQALVPYSSYNYRVEVLFPVYMKVPKPHKPLPIITVADVKEWIMSIDELVNDENDRLYNLVRMLIVIAKETIAYDLCGSDESYKRVVAYYVGHYLQMHLDEMKDEENRMSLVHSVKNDSENDEMKKVKFEYDLNMGDYKKTMLGRMFWTIYGQHAKFLVGYAPL